MSPLGPVEHIVIVLIDDDPKIVKTVQRYLHQAGYTVRVAYDGKDALAIAIERDQAPDCIVLDVALPDYDGWEITQRIRANPRSAASLAEIGYLRVQSLWLDLLFLVGGTSILQGGFLRYRSPASRTLLPATNKNLVSSPLLKRYI